MLSILICWSVQYASRSYRSIDPIYWVAITWLAYPLSYDLTSSIVLTSSCSSRRSYLSNWHTCNTRSVTLFPPSLALSSKILPISRLSTRGTVSSSLICCLPLLIPPPYGLCKCEFRCKVYRHIVYFTPFGVKYTDFEIALI